MDAINLGGRRKFQASFVGKRSGVKVPKDIRKDSLGFDDVDEFWADSSSDEEEEQQQRRKKVPSIKEPHIPSVSSDPLKTSSSPIVPNVKVHPESNAKHHEINVSVDVPVQATHVKQVSVDSPANEEEQHQYQDDDFDTNQQFDDDDDDIPEPQSPVFHESSEMSVPMEDLPMSPIENSVDSPHSTAPSTSKKATTRSSSRRISSSSTRSSTSSSYATPGEGSRARRFSNMGSRRRRSSVSSRRSSIASSVAKTPNYEHNPKYAVTPATDISSSIAYAGADSLDETFNEDESVAYDESDVSKCNETSIMTDASVVLEESFDHDAAEEILGDDAAAEDSDDDAPRRSKRRRFKPLEWYKGEHVAFERRQSGVGAVMPTVVGVVRDGTKTPRNIGNHKRRKTARSLAFPTEKLPKDYTYKSSDSVMVYDDETGTGQKKEIVSRKSKLHKHKLPGKAPVGTAAEAFNVKGHEQYPSWISGNLEVLPLGLKEPEAVDDCTQLYYVVSGQPRSLEVAIAAPVKNVFDEKTAQRITLSPGDEFYVPPKNSYMLWNHSEDTKSVLRFVVLKPTNVVDD